MATFGRTDTTGVNQLNNISNNAISGGKYTLSENGTVTKVSIFLKKQSGTSSVKAVIVGASDGKIVSNGVSGGVSITSTSYGWIHFTFTNNPSLTAGDYILCLVASVSGGFGPQHAGNSTGGASKFASNNYATPTDPGTSTPAAWKLCIYATYTPATSVKSVNGVLIASVSKVNGLAIASVKSIDGLA